MIWKLIRCCLLCMVVLSAVSGYAATEDDISQHRSCNFCGMDRKAYGYSRMVVVYADGTSSGVCSLHCAVTELQAGGNRPVEKLLVADRDTRMMIDAKQAAWVIGGRKKGVMTQRPKWAFAAKAGADSFIAANGGTLADWETVFAAAKEDAVPKPHH